MRRAAPPGLLPGLMLGRPWEGGGEAVVVVGGRDGDGLQAAVEDVVIDAVMVDELIQQAAQGALSNRWKAWLLGRDGTGRPLIQGCATAAGRDESRRCGGSRSVARPTPALRTPRWKQGVAGQRHRDVEGPAGAAQNGGRDADVAGIEARPPP